VTETFGDDALCEGCLPLLRHAVAHYLDPEVGQVIPRALSLHAALAVAPRTTASAALLDDRIGGLARGLGALAPRRTSMDLRPEPPQWCSRPIRLWGCNLGAPPDLSCTPARGTADVAALPPPGASASSASAIVSWFELEFGDGVKPLSSSPESSTHWRQFVIPLETSALHDEDAVPSFAWAVFDDEHEVGMFEPECMECAAVGAEYLCGPATPFAGRLRHFQLD